MRILPSEIQPGRTLASAVGGAPAHAPGPRWYLSTLLLLTFSVMVRASDQLPVLDMHLHALRAADQGPPPLAMCTPVELPVWDPAEGYEKTYMRMLKEPSCDDPIWSPQSDDEVRERTLEVMRRNNVYGVLSGSEEKVDEWMAEERVRFLPGLALQVADPNAPSVDTVRKRHAEGKLAVLAEVVNQYAGVEPSDPRMAPYWKLAEEMDLPVGIHMGPGPPGVIYLGAAQYRARMHSPLTIEEVLVSHPKLRVYLMHAGFPMLDDLLALLYAHPQVYVEVGVIVYTQPRAAFYRYLQGVFDAGFGKRVMFGSDQMVWPEVIERGISVINEAPFLNDDQKRDILYNNAARFLRLPQEVIEQHHGR